MHNKDLYGLKVSCSNEALQSWATGLDASLTFDASGIDELNEAIHIDPEFAIAHATLGRQLIIHGFRDEGVKAISLAVELTNTRAISTREISQIKILEAVTQFQANSLAMALEHLERWPVDVMVLSLVIGPFGLLAFSGKSSWREECVALLNGLRHQWPKNDWWFQNSLAFSLSEAGALEESKELCEHAWSLRPTGSCAHSLSHVQIELGDYQVAHTFLDQWMVRYGNESDMRHHLHWHGAFLNFDECHLNQQSATQLFRSELDASVCDPMPLTTYSDNASFLWRLGLLNISCEDEFIEQTRQYGLIAFPNQGFAFADFHTMMLEALSQNTQAKSLLLTNFQQLYDPKMARLLSGLCDGFFAFTRRDYAAACSALQPILKDSVLLGGSNPQRRIVEETYIEACARLGDLTEHSKQLSSNFADSQSPYYQQRLRQFRNLH